mmetsp:Transcript_32983/g.75985  ORF Transcript_32983/g.75985 Transcript_32983/m.75985 type:complete len:101 (-) Transcript_32983:55-357(-)
MKEFFASPAWKQQIEGDQLLYEAANKSLDMTIEGLGRLEFETNLRKFRKLQQLVQSKCVPYVETPCTPGGIRRRHPVGCLWRDSGCGTPCINDVLATMVV